MYVFRCDNGHTSHSAAKEQKDMSCPTCGAPAELVEGLEFEAHKIGSEYEPREETIIWSFDYAWAEPVGAYAKLAGDVGEEELIALVQSRALKDGEWSIANGHVGENNESEPLMRKMMAWVSNSRNITQCAYANRNETVEWVCRDLANGSKWVGGSRD